MELTAINTASAEAGRRVGLRNAVQVITSPRSLFGRIEDSGAYGWMLFVLLTAVVLLGYMQIQTGLIDRVVDQQTEASLAQLEATQAHLIDRMELRDRMEGVRKAGEFQKVITRLGVVVFAPLRLLASCLLIASALYAVVALTGRKPEFHTLMAICVYSALIDLIASALRLAMMLYYRTLDVDTSLRLLAGGEGPTVLAGIDPFRIWFWVLVAIGLTATHQLSRRMAIVSCVVLGVLATGGHIAAEFAQHASGAAVS